MSAPDSLILAESYNIMHIYNIHPQNKQLVLSFKEIVLAPIAFWYLILYVSKDELKCSSLVYIALQRKERLILFCTITEWASDGWHRAQRNLFFSLQ